MRPNHSILYNALLLTGVNLLLRGVSMLFQVYLSGLIGAAGIGLLQLILTVGGFAMTIGMSGVRVAAMYLTAEEYGRRRFAGMKSAVGYCMAYGMVFSVLVGVALYFCADFAATQWVQDARAALAIRLLAVSLPLNCLCSILSGYFTACNKIRSLVIVEVLERFLALGITVLLLLWAAGDVARVCAAIILGSTIATIFSTALLFASFLRDCRSYGSTFENLDMRRRLLRLCIPLALNDYLRSGLNTVEQFLIPRGLARAGSSRDASMAAYGTIHGMVFPILMFPAAIIYSLSDLMVPELARCRAEQDSRRILHLTDKCVRMGMLFSASVAGLMYLLSDSLGQLIYQSADAGYYLRLFAPTILMLYLDALVDGMHKGLGQQVYCVRYNTLTSFMDVVLLFFLLPRWGIAGYFFSFTFTHAVNFYLSIRRLLVVTDYQPTLVFTFQALCGGLICTMLCSLLTGLLPVAWVKVAVLPPVFLVGYFAFLSACGAMKHTDWRWLRHALRAKRSQTVD